MKTFGYALAFLVVVTSCDTPEIKPRIDKLALLSGDNPSGRKWKMTSFKSVSNYCTADVNKFLTTESCDNYPESIKDNVTIIYPDGKINVDEGMIRYNDDSPQIYVDLQFWTLNTAQDSVTIVDYVGLPSLNATWGLEVWGDKFVLSYKEINALFDRSLLTHSVTFHLVRE